MMTYTKTNVTTTKDRAPAPCQVEPHGPWVIQLPDGRLWFEPVGLALDSNNPPEWWPTKEQGTQALEDLKAVVTQFYGAVDYEPVLVPWTRKPVR